jgi:tRNA A-37 threonylcarbamoyl transferase component Bud32
MSPPGRDEDLPPGLAERLDPVCDRFESDWLADRRPRLEDFLTQVDPPDRPALVRELLELDLHYRARRGETPGPEEYRQRLPEYTELVARVFATSRRSGRPAAENGSPPQTSLDRTFPTRSAEDAPRPGESLRDYEVLEELGRGGMGVVYKARQKRLNRVVALKMILAGGHASAEELARLRTEAEALGRLQHPNIVQVHEVGEHQGKPFFSLEFCPGGSLDKRLAGSPLPPPEAAALTQTLARATHAAHRAQVVHRDLKPANVLLRADGTPKITDFGLAKKLDDDAGPTRPGETMGTPSYMAPEQAEGGREVGPAADVYALGAILYELLTGRPPFKAATPFDTLRQVVTAEPVPPRQLNPKVPADLETVCLKCLRKEPGRRYPSAEHLADDLGRWQRGEPVQARPVGAAERLLKWARRRPAVAALLAALAVLGAVALAVTTVLYRDAVWQAAEAAREALRAGRAEVKAEKQRDRAREEEGRARRERDLARAEEERARQQLTRAE